MADPVIGGVSKQGLLEALENSAGGASCGPCSSSLVSHHVCLASWPSQPHGQERRMGRGGNDSTRSSVEDGPGAME
jgi:hypothetical protein